MEVLTNKSGLNDPALAVFRLGLRALKAAVHAFMSSS